MAPWRRGPLRPARPADLFRRRRGADRRTVFRRDGGGGSRAHARESERGGRRPARVAASVAPARLSRSLGGVARPRPRGGPVRRSPSREKPGADLCLDRVVGRPLTRGRLHRQRVARLRSVARRLRHRGRAGSPGDQGPGHRLRLDLSAGARRVAGGHAVARVRVDRDRLSAGVDAVPDRRLRPCLVGPDPARHGVLRPRGLAGERGRVRRPLRDAGPLRAYQPRSGRAEPRAAARPDVGSSGRPPCLPAWWAS